MTREQAKRLLPVIEDFVAGETVQLRNGDQWLDVDDPTFTSEPERYRIKPKGPLVRWVNVYRTPEGGEFVGAVFFDTKEDANRGASFPNRVRCARLVEIPEQEDQPRSQPEDKPKPREFWINRYSGSAFVHETEKAAVVAARSGRKLIERIHVVEVPDNSGC